MIQQIMILMADLFMVYAQHLLPSHSSSLVVLLLIREGSDTWPLLYQTLQVVSGFREPLWSAERPYVFICYARICMATFNIYTLELKYG